MQTTRPQNFLAALACCLAAGWIVAPNAQAQSEESDPAPALGEFEPAPLPPPNQPFLIPDVSQSLVDHTQIKERWFTAKFGLVVLADYNSFHQDANSLSQVGRQPDGWDDRSLRVMMRGTIGTGYQFSYLFAGEYKGFDTEPGDLWNLTDLSFTLPLAGPATKLTVGKTKESFAYEMVGDAANLPQQERVLSPFFVSRNVGAKLTQVFGADQRMTLSGGVFNDWWVTGDAQADSGTDVAARFTGLAWDQPDGKRFLHLGLSGRYAGADNNTMRYKGRPESNVTDPYVDTGDLSGDHAWHLGLEALWNEGPFFVLAEYNRAWVTSPTSGDPQFSGYYVTASWILTGETRPAVMDPEVTCSWRTSPPTGLLSPHRPCCSGSSPLYGDLDSCAAGAIRLRFGTCAGVRCEPLNRSRRRWPIRRRTKASASASTCCRSAPPTGISLSSGPQVAARPYCKGCSCNRCCPASARTWINAP